MRSCYSGELGRAIAGFLPGGACAAGWQAVVLKDRRMLRRPHRRAKNAPRRLRGRGGLWQPIVALEAVCQIYVATE